MPSDHETVVVNIPSKVNLYGESPSIAIGVWVIGVLIMTQLVSYNISACFELIMDSLYPGGGFGIIIETCKNVISIPLLLIVGFFGSRYPYYLVLGSIAGIIACGSAMLCVVERNPTAIAYPVHPQSASTIYIAYGFVDGLFVPVLMMGCLVFCVDFLSPRGRQESHVPWYRRRELVTLALVGIHNVFNTRMGMTSLFPRFRPTEGIARVMMVSMIILGSLLAAGVSIRLKLLREVTSTYIFDPVSGPISRACSLETLVTPVSRDRKTLARRKIYWYITLILLMVICLMWQDIFLRHYNPIMVDIVGPSWAPLIAEICGIFGVVIGVIVWRKWRTKNRWLSACIVVLPAIVLVAILLPIATKNGYFILGFFRTKLVGAPAVVIAMMIVYACIPLLIGRIYFQVTSYIKPGNELIAHALLASGFALARVASLWIYQLSHWWYFTHILAGIFLACIVAIYLMIDSRRHSIDLAIRKPPTRAAGFTVIHNFATVCDGLRAPVSSPRFSDIPAPSAPLLDFSKYRQESIASTVVVFSPVAKVSGGLYPPLV
jgi:hypothetical protein